MNISEQPLLERQPVEITAVKINTSNKIFALFPTCTTSVAHMSEVQGFRQFPWQAVLSNVSLERWVGSISFLDICSLWYPPVCLQCVSFILWISQLCLYSLSIPKLCTSRHASFSSRQWTHSNSKVNRTPHRAVSILATWGFLNTKISCLILYLQKLLLCFGFM